MFVVNEALFNLSDPVGDVMNVNEEKVGGYPNIDMTNITIWMVGDYLLYEMNVVGTIQDQMVGGNVYYYGLGLFIIEF